MVTRMMTSRLDSFVEAPKRYQLVCHACKGCKPTVCAQGIALHVRCNLEGQITQKLPKIKKKTRRLLKGGRR